MATGDPAKRGVSMWKWVSWTALMLVVCAAADETHDGGRHSHVLGLCMDEPAVRVDCYPPVANFPNATEEACLAHGCCWKPLENNGIPCAFDAAAAPSDKRCANVANASRVACRNPRFALSEVANDEETCRSIGCCFDADADACFQPFFEGYELLTLEETEDGWRGTLVLRRFTRGPFGNDLPLLALHVIKESPSRVRIRITDPSFPRYEVSGVGRTQMTMQDGDEEEDADVERAYDVHFSKRPFGVAVTRRATGEVLFNSTPSVHAASSFNGLVFANQFLEISTHLEAHGAFGSPVLYGLGERWGRARLHADRKGDHYPMFSRRAHEVAPHTRDGGDNLGGVHPFYLQILDSGRAHGVFFLSSNAMEVVTQEDALTFRSTGGVFDFFVFAGPTPADVTSEYTKVVGRPEIPPVWALGYHYGKRGHRSLEETMLEVAGLREAGVPLDAYWQDVDYMYNREAFTLDESKFPLQETQDFVDDLHFNNQYYVVLMTPAVPTEPTAHSVDHAVIVDDSDALEYDDASGSEEGTAGGVRPTTTRYYPLERGGLMNVFVKGIQGDQYAEKLVGSHWSAFVDFSHPNATSFWREMLRSFHEQMLPFDGVWIDSDEPAATCDTAFSGPSHQCGSIEDEGASGSRGDGDVLVTLQVKSDSPATTAVGDGSFVRSLDVAFPFDPYRQPFVPGQGTTARGGHGNLNAATLPMAALHHTSLHYNIHSLYGHQQAKTTRHALNRVLKRRSISLSRATYPGDGRYTGHLNGDVEPTWENLRFSVASTVEMSLAGIPFSGPSIGGNGVGISRELSIRWHQAASFFPLVRNHASRDAAPQSPVDFDQETANIIRDTLLRRYRHLPYLYTQFYRAHVHGDLVIRGLATEFPTDPVAIDTETQYLVGPALMVSPVVDEHAISTRVYFPNATWYDLESGRMLAGLTERDAGVNERFVQLLTPLPTLQVHVRGGFIVPTQQASTTAAITKRGVYRLVVALDPSTGTAAGGLFVDDGDSLYSVQDGRFSFVMFHASLKDGHTLEFKSQRELHGYDGPEMHVDLEEIVVFGVRGGFLANSSLHVHGASQHSELKADYFEQADMLVLTRLAFPIGDEFDLSVEAKNEGAPGGGAGGEGEHEEGDVDVGDGNDDADDEGRESEEGEHAGEGAAEAHGGKEHDEGDEKGGRDDQQPPPIKEEQHGKKKGMTAIGIIGIVAGVIFIAGIFFVVLQRRRTGYNPIA